MTDRHSKGQEGAALSRPETFEIRIEGEAGSFRCRSDQPVLIAMRAAGKAGLPVGCRSGGCGICRIKIAKGDIRTGYMSSAFVSPEDKEAGYALACRVYPKSDLEVTHAPCRSKSQSTPSRKAQAA